MAETTTGPRYETAHELSERTGKTDTVVCTECGAFVMNVAAHDRHHAILDRQALALAILGTAHGSAAAHDKYDTAERIGWKGADALVVAADSGYQDQIVKWSDVRAGDLVLFDDGLIVAERVDLVQKPWGNGTTFTAADITWHDDEGHRFCSERHGDRFTAIRRPMSRSRPRGTP